jgi:hypothetical protein
MGCQKLPHCRDKLFLLEEKFGMLPEWCTTLFLQIGFFVNVAYELFGFVIQSTINGQPVVPPHLKSSPTLGRVFVAE